MDVYHLETINLNDNSVINGQNLVQACVEFGFVMVKEHGFGSDEVLKYFEYARSFFQWFDDLDDNNKEKYLRVNSNAGYTSFSSESLNPEDIGDPKESFDFANFNFDNVPVQELPEFWIKKIKEIKLLREKLVKIVDKLLFLLAVGLEIKDDKGKLDPHYFIREHSIAEDNGSCLRLLHYPKNLATIDKTVAGEHTDYGTLSILFQDPTVLDTHSGLQILSPVTDEWVRVPKCEIESNGEIPLIVNIGDLLNFWSNGYLKSTPHRVKFDENLFVSGRDRYSIVYFVHPNNKTLLNSLRSDLIQQSNRKSMTAEQHLLNKLNKSYKW